MEFIPSTAKIFLWQEMTSLDSKFLPLADFFLWQDILSCDRNCHPVTEDFLLWQGISFCDLKCCPVIGNFLMTQEISSWTGNSFIWPEISSCDREFLSVTTNFFPGQEISSFGTKLPTQNFYPGQEILQNCITLIWKCNKSVWFFVIYKNGNKSAWYLFKKFAWEFKASWQDFCHLAS